MKFVIKSGGKKGQKYHVVLIGDNGEPVMSSEKLSSRQACHTNIEAVQAGAADAMVVDESMPEESPLQEDIS